MRALGPDDASRIQLLRGVAWERVAPLLTAAPIRELADGEVLITPGPSDGRLYIVLDGELRVHVGTVENEAVATLRPGESVGELSLLDDQPRSAFVVAHGACRLLALPEATFWTLVKAEQAVSLNLMRSLASRLRGGNTAVTESRRLQHEYRRHAQIDALTGLYNRRWLDEILPRQVKRSLIVQQPLSVVMVDIDHFKRLNDTHGHQAGDFVLFVVARLLKANVRPTDLVARYGGEEFTVMLPQTQLDSAVVASERVREEVSTTPIVMPDERKLEPVTLSLGIATLEPGMSAEELVGAADAALYRAKHGGRNRTSY